MMWSASGGTEHAEFWSPIDFEDNVITNQRRKHAIGKHVGNITTHNNSGPSLRATVAFIIFRLSSCRANDLDSIPSIGRSETISPKNFHNILILKQLIFCWTPRALVSNHHFNCISIGIWPFHALHVPTIYGYYVSNVFCSIHKPVVAAVGDDCATWNIVSNFVIVHRSGRPATTFIILIDELLVNRKEDIDLCRTDFELLKLYFERTFVSDRTSF